MNVGGTRASSQHRGQLFPSKDRLVVTYLTQADDALRDRFAAALTTSGVPVFGAARSPMLPPSTQIPGTGSTKPSSDTASGSWRR